MMNLLALIASVAVHSAVTNGVEVRWFEEMVPMRDGTRLYTCGALPPDGETRALVVTRTPYARREPQDMVAYAYGQRGALARGYAYVNQHVRGSGRSEGGRIVYVDERTDGLDFLAWARTLPHYRGEIFLEGASYNASVHWSYLDAAPDDVKGAVLSVQDVNRYNIHYRNGNYKIALHGNWTIREHRKNDLTLRRDPSAKFTDLPLKGFSERRLGERVADLEETWEHPRPNDPWWRTPGTAGGEYRRALLDSKLPVLLVTGFYDIYTEGIFDMWRELPAARRANCALVVDAGGHGDRARGEEDGPLDWFDWCRGRKDALKRTKPGMTVWKGVWSGTWESAPELTDAPETLALHLADGGRLSSGPAACAPVAFAYDPKDPPRFNSVGCLTFGGRQEQPETGWCKDVITFTGEPFADETRIRGRMRLNLAVKSDCEDTAFYVRLSVKRADDGKWYNVRDDIRTILWDRADYVPGETVTLDYVLSDLAATFAKGDVLRLEIAGASANQFLPHTNFRGPFHVQAKSRVAHNAVCGGTLTIPVVAGGPLTFDFAKASKAMYPPCSGVGGNLIKVADGAFAGNGGCLRCIQKKPDPDILRKIRTKVTTRFANGEGLIVVDESIREFFRENPIEAVSVAALLTQTVDLPDDRGGLYAITFDSLNGGSPGLLTGAFITPQHVDADGTVRPVGKEMRRRTIGDDSEWFPVRWTVLVPSGANRVRINMCRYNVGRFVFRNVSMTRLDVSNQPKVTLRQGAHGCADPSFAIGEGQSGYITWEWKHRYDFTPLKAKDVRFELILPKGFELRSLTFAREKTIRTEPLEDGSTRVTFEPAGHNAVPGESFERRAQMGAIVLATAGAGCEGLGTLRALTADGADYSTVVTTRYYTVEAVRAKAVPKTYTNGLLPILDKFSGTEGELAFAETAVAAGARWLVAGQFTGTPVWLSAWRTAGMRTITDTAAVVRDGYYIGPSKGRPEADRFRTAKGVHNAQHLACPSSVYEERPFFLTNTVPFIKSRLAGFDGLWSNWEPYRYFGRNACMCDTCRRKFAEYVGVSEEEMKKDWPKELFDGGKWAGRIEAFRAREHGRLVKTVDKYVRAATGGEKSVGFMPGISWSQVASTWRQNNTSPEICHLEYAGSLRWLEPWGPYPHWDNTSPYFHTEGSGMIESFLAARDVRRQINRDYPLPGRPRIQGFPQGYQCGWIVQPEWMEMELDSYFFNGWESAILYHFPGGYDARYWRALANATERAAKYEDYVFKGRRCDEEIAVTVDPACRKAVRNPSRHLTNLQEVSLVQHVAYRLGGKVLVAVFNFREVPVKLTIGSYGSFTVPAARTTVFDF